MVIKKLTSLVKETYWKLWYGYISKSDKDNELTFMNYGYASSPPINMNPDSEKNRFQIQLYDKVVRSIPGPLDEVDMLEIGSGRGGGATYIARDIVPNSYKGVDICQPAVDFCNKHNPFEEVSFQQGDAMNLPLEDEKYSAVINVESSHRYPDMPQFLNEVNRVLQIGGHFSMVDFRATNKIEVLENQLYDSDMKIIEKEDITPGVIKSLELDDARKLEMVDRLIPRILHKPAREFASVVGSASYNSLKSGERTYMRYLLRK